MTCFYSLYILPNPYFIPKHYEVGTLFFAGLGKDDLSSFFHRVLGIRLKILKKVSPGLQQSGTVVSYLELDLGVLVGLVVGLVVEALARAWRVMELFAGLALGRGRFTTFRHDCF